NDGIYMPFDEIRFKKFRKGMLRLHEEVIRAGATIVHLTPPVYDEKNGGKKGYDKVLERYGIWLLEMEKKENWKVVDIHEPMKAYLFEQRGLKPGYSFSADGVHPDPTGHWLMARELLVFLGNETVAGAVSLKEA